MKFLLPLLFALQTLPAFADYCLESKIIEHEFNAADFKEVELKALAGDLEVTSGDAGTIRFWGKVCTDTERHLNMIDLDILKENGKLTLIAVIPYHQDDFDPSIALLDIELTLPSEMPLRLRDSSGDMTVSDVSVTSIEDSSGDIRVRNGRADLSVRDSSGQIYVRGVSGSVKVSDSSGDIDINNVDGDVEIPGDSSGDVEISDVKGTVIVARDGSGDIDIEHVGKDVLIGSDGSGDISIEDVKGMVRIEADGSGSVRVDDVAGDFELSNKGDGEIRTSDIAGRINTPR
jgi:hypothetical protein